MPEVFDDLDKLPKEVLKEVKSYLMPTKLTPLPIRNLYKTNLDLI